MDVWGIVRGVAAKRGEDGDAAKGKTSASKDTSSTAKETAKDATTASNKEPTASDKSQAEALKAEGNALITRRLYSSAIEKYTAAIALDPGNAVYYSNRAAAWGAMGEHAEAVKDAEEAVKRDPGFGRGWSRLGHAQYSLGNYSEAVKAYTQGLTIDPANANMQQALAQAKAKEAAQQATQAEDSDEDAEDGEVTRAGGASAAGGRAGGAGGMPDLSSMADLLGSLGGGGNGTGGPGGMPDLAGLMSNPAIMQMAQSMMANGGLDKLMSNPAMRNMAERMSSGGGMPDMDALRNDPEMRNLAVEWIVERGASCDSRPILCPLLTVPVTGGVASSDSYADTNYSTYESSQVKDAMAEATRKAITSFIRSAWGHSEKRPWFLGEFVNLLSLKQSRQGVVGDLDKANS
ncbi:hypothetical protein QFC24_006667 [Naganishia onofrii]|uniref:Uncharacterized protein n=1 Tax=Naganishia onofrii TaxID=1851511 RepID=A0ACC2X050_9TREE|nr:hypothetical protein QFC24_006667 [Naganishia onofrii]